MIIGFHCGWEIRETPAGNVVLNVIDSFDELNWLVGEKWFEKPRKGEKSLVFSLSKRKGVRFYFNRKLMTLTVSMSYKCEIKNELIYGHI